MLFDCAMVLYIIYVLMIVLHELFHVLAAKVLKFNIVKIELGSFLFVNIGRLYISPLIFSGAVHIDFDDALAKKKSYIVIFFLSGMLGNLLFLLISMVIIDNTIILIWIVIINLISIIFSILPLSGDNDVSLLWDCLRKVESK